MKVVAQRFLNAITFLTVLGLLLLVVSAISKGSRDLYEVMPAVAIVGNGFVAFANYVFFGKLTLWHRFDEQA